VNKILFNGFAREYQSIGADIMRRIEHTISSQNFILGEAVETFEKRIADYLNPRIYEGSGQYRSIHTIGVSSGTDAILMALMALGIKAGDEVIVPAYSFVATGTAVLRVGAIPVFADIDPTTFNVTAQSIHKCISDHTKAIICVHLFGMPCDMHAIKQMGIKYNLHIVEDCAQALGAEYNNMKVGTIGDIGCFSFFPAKNLGAYGDGGLVTTAYPAIAEQLISIRVHGKSPSSKYENNVLGGNFRLDAVQASILAEKLKYLDFHNDTRRVIAKWYDTHLENYCEIPQILDIPYDFKSSYNQYVIKTVKRDKVIKALRDNNIEYAIYYPKPMSEQKCFGDYMNYNCANAKRCAEQCVALPIHPYMHIGEVHKIVQVVRDALSR